jgi:hypothetical protein
MPLRYTQNIHYSFPRSANLLVPTLRIHYSFPRSAWERNCWTLRVLGFREDVDIG